MSRNTQLVVICFVTLYCIVQKSEPLQETQRSTLNSPIYLRTIGYYRNNETDKTIRKRIALPTWIDERR